MSARTRKRRARATHVLVHDRIDTERRQLQKASAVLVCLIYAVQHDAEVAGVQFGDAAIVARELIDDAVTALDPMNLQRPAALKAEA